MDRLSFNPNPSAGAQIVHSTPLGGYSSSTSPSNSAARFLWINRVPNPVRLGGKTGGPFLSRQRRRNSRPCRWGAKVQAISIYPSSFDNAPYLGRIGPEFMQGQSKGQRRLRTKTDLRAFRPNPVPAAPRIGCKNAVDDSPQIDSGPVRLEQYLVRASESFETGIERGAGVLPWHVEPQRRVRDRLHHCKRIPEPMTQLVNVVASRFRPRAFFRDVTDMSPLARFGFY